jgi:hypothetical protein
MQAAGRRSGRRHATASVAPLCVADAAARAPSRNRHWGGHKRGRTGTRSSACCRSEDKAEGSRILCTHRLRTFLPPAARNHSTEGRSWEGRPHPFNAVLEGPWPLRRGAGRLLRLPPAGRTRTTFSPVSTDAESLAGLSALSHSHQEATSAGRINVEDAARADNSGYDWTTWTFVACSPFWPCVTSNSTFAPSASVLKPLPAMPV